MRAFVQFGFVVKVRDDDHLAAIIEATSAGFMAGLADKMAEYGLEQEQVDREIVMMPAVAHTLPEFLEWE